MNKAALIESLMATYVEELAEHVRSFNVDLLALESGTGDPATLLQSLFRTAHNLKGALGAIGATTASTLAAQLEAMGHEAHLDGAARLIERLEGELARMTSFWSGPGGRE